MIYGTDINAFALSERIVDGKATQGAALLALG